MEGAAEPKIMKIRTGQTYRADDGGQFKFSRFDRVDGENGNVKKTGAEGRVETQRSTEAESWFSREQFKEIREERRTRKRKRNIKKRIMNDEYCRATESR
jgi:hypothetical protein